MRQPSFPTPCCPPVCAHGLTRAANIWPKDIDGLVLSSFTTAPDTAVGVTQHLSLSPRIGTDQLPPKGAEIVSAPLKIKNGSGSPLRVLALVGAAP